MVLRSEQLERYARHIILREIGGPGQKKFLQSRVLCIGAGGLGSPALMYLAAAGVGYLGIVDDDRVSLSNLQRQILHATHAVGELKTDSAAAAIDNLNPDITVVSHTERLTRQNAATLISEYDLVLDGCDNFPTRYIVNETCARLHKPLVSGAIGPWEGQVTLFKPWQGTPCYACIFPKPPADGLAPSCAEAGVLGALAGVVGSLMAVEALKEIAGVGSGLDGSLLLYDALYAETRRIIVKPNPECKVCHPDGSPMSV